MRLSRRGQVIAWVAIVAGLMLLVSMRTFLASQSPEHESVAAESSPGETLPSRQSDGEPATQLVAPVAPPGAEPILPKRRGQTLTGRVYDQATSAGIAAATLAFRDMQVGRYDGNWRSRPQFRTSEDGTFKLDGVPPGRITLDVSKTGYASREIFIAVAVDANPSLEIALTAGAAISGRLTAADTVTPVAGRVALQNLEDVSGTTRMTGPAGEFSYSALAPGSYRLTGHGNGSFAERDISLVAGERIDDLVLTLQAGSTVRGTITGLRSQELAQTNISILHRDRQDSLLATRPDERGNYVIAGVPSGPLTVYADTKRRSLARRIELPTEGDITVDFDFPRGWRLSGRVMRRGKPLAQVTIDQVNSVEPGSRVHAITTSAGGEYAFDDLPDGEYRFSIGGYFAPPVRVAGNTVFDFDVPSLRVSGTLVDASRREPVAWASVFVAPALPGNPARSRRVETNPFGKFSFDAPEPGDYIVTVYKPGYAVIRERVTVGAADADLSFALTADEGIRIRLRTADGAPVRMVFLSARQGDMLLRGFALRLDERGEGHLPRTFVGSSLQLYRDDLGSLAIPRWNGDALDLRLTPDAP